MHFVMRSWVTAIGAILFLSVATSCVAADEPDNYPQQRAKLDGRNP